MVFAEMDKSDALLAVLQRTAEGMTEDIERAKAREIERFKVSILTHLDWRWAWD